MEKVVKIVSFQEAEELDIQYWRNASPEEKLDTVQRLREISYGFKNENRKRIRKTYRIVKQRWIAKLDLIKNKMATGRKQDLGDIEKLQKI